MNFIICSSRNNKCVPLCESAHMTQQQKFTDLKKKKCKSPDMLKALVRILY